MLYTHLSLSFLPIFISFCFAFFFLFLTLFFVFHVSPYFFVFFLFFFFFCMFFTFFFYLSIIEFSLFLIIFSYDSSFILAINLISPFGLALFNTFLLLLSSAYAVVFHVNHLNHIFDYSLIWCFIFGFFFIVNQYIEFYVCSFTISSYSFCSIFFFGTGFHGFHVFVGLLLILSNIVVLYLYNHNLVFYLNCSLLYWHFVDVVWLFLFVFVYIITFLLLCS